MYEHAAVQDQDDVREDTPTTQSAAVQSSKIQHMPSDDSSALASSSSAALPLPSSRVDAIAEARRYRKRAQAAEQSLETLKQELAAREQELAMQSQRLLIWSVSERLTMRCLLPMRLIWKQRESLRSDCWRRWSSRMWKQR